MRQQGELFRLVYRDQTCFRLNLRSLFLSQKPAGAMHSRVVSLLAASVLGTLLYGATGRGLQQQSAAGPASEAGTPSKVGGGETQATCLRSTPGRLPALHLAAIERTQVGVWAVDTFPLFYHTPNGRTEGTRAAVVGRVGATAHGRTEGGAFRRQGLQQCPPSL